MVEYVRVPGKARIRASIEKLSRRVPEKGRICMSTENGGIRPSTGTRYNPCEYRKTFPASNEKWSNLSEYREMLNPGEYREKVESVRVSKNCPEEYRKMLESV